MILRPKDKKHCEFIVKKCIEHGMDDLHANGHLWNHLVSLFKKFELIEVERDQLKVKIELIKSLPLMNGIEFEDIENQYRETIDRIKNALQ